MKVLNKLNKLCLSDCLGYCLGYCLGLLLWPAVAIALPSQPTQPQPAETPMPEPSAKITFDLSELSEEGLTRESPRAIDYEFCIPATAAHEAEVQAIDPSMQLMRHSRGRIGCRPNQVLCIGNTHQANWREILSALAALDYVERIDQTFWE